MAIRTINTVTTWGGEAVAPPAGTATEYIEGGDVLVLRNLPLEIASEERSLFTASASDGRSKSISFDPTTSRLDGCAFTGRERALLVRMFGPFVQAFMDRLAGVARLVDSVQLV